MPTCTPTGFTTLTLTTQIPHAIKQQSPSASLASVESDPVQSARDVDFDQLTTFLTRNRTFNIMLTFDALVGG